MAWEDYAAYGWYLTDAGERLAVATTRRDLEAGEVEYLENQTTTGAVSEGVGGQVLATRVGKLANFTEDPSVLAGP